MATWSIRCLNLWQACCSVVRVDYCSTSPSRKKSILASLMSSMQPHLRPQSTPHYSDSQTKCSPNGRKSITQNLDITFHEHYPHACPLTQLVQYDSLQNLLPGIGSIFPPSPTQRSKSQCLSGALIAFSTHSTEPTKNKIGGKKKRNSRKARKKNIRTRSSHAPHVQDSYSLVDGFEISCRS